MASGKPLPLDAELPPPGKGNVRVWEWRDGALAAQVVQDGTPMADHRVHRCPRRPASRGPVRHNPRGSKRRQRDDDRQLDLF